MITKRSVLVWWWLPTLLCLLGSGAFASPYFLFDSFEEWQMQLRGGSNQSMIESVMPEDWQGYMQHWARSGEGDPPPMDSQYMVPELYVYEGGEPGTEDPDSACLVMVWGGQDPPAPMDWAAAWQLSYGVDPDLSNSTITLQVHPPPGIVNVSFSLQDINGWKCSWNWNCGPGGQIPFSPPWTTITINTANIGLGVNCPTPGAAGFAKDASFDISKVASMLINETFHTTPGTFTIPPGGSGGGNFGWNAWDSFNIVPNVGGGNGPDVNSKWFLKWSQPPKEVDEGLIWGWDEQSVYHMPPIMADDWLCKDERPVTDIHWWGSFIGWTQPYIPPHLMPTAFHIGIWTDKPDPDPDNPATWSAPRQLVWQNYCDNFVWNFAGYDLDPREDATGVPQTENEACFQFTQLLSQDEWFHQKPLDPDDPGVVPGRVYWVSIAAIYANYPDIPPYLWGWKTRPHHFNDDAVHIWVIENPDGTTWPAGAAAPIQLQIGATAMQTDPLKLDGKTWYLAFELTTNVPAYEDNPIPGDLDYNGKVNLIDFAIFASNWDP